jgi:hypothetical protein
VKEQKPGYEIFPALMLESPLNLALSGSGRGKIGAVFVLASRVRRIVFQMR